MEQNGEVDLAALDNLEHKHKGAPDDDSKSNLLSTITKQLVHTPRAPGVYTDDPVLPTKLSAAPYQRRNCGPATLFEIYLQFIRRQGPRLTDGAGSIQEVIDLHHEALASGTSDPSLWQK
jgi:hypothetical protein